MFEKIKEILIEIDRCPNIYVSQNSEFVLEPLKYDSDVKDYIKYLKFTIIRIGKTYDNIIYRASCKENNPSKYLENIYEDLKKVKAVYIPEEGQHE